MMELKRLMQCNRTIRVAGVDDAHSRNTSAGDAIPLAVIVCGETTFEGMLWNHLAKDGMDSTDVVTRVIGDSKFYRQLHLVLLDGITFGGCNVIDLPLLSDRLKLPVAAVMRRPPNLDDFRHVVELLPDSEERWRRTQAAGVIHEFRGGCFQLAGESADVMAQVLDRLTVNGKVPEPLRLAHLIGSAVVFGESSKRA